MKPQVDKRTGARFQSRATPVQQTEHTLLSSIGLGAPASDLDLEGVDWAAFRQLSGRHRVDGLAARWLAENQSARAPQSTREEFRASYRSQLMDYLVHASETVRLSQGLGRSGIQALVLKGCDTAERLYQPHPAVRHSIDIDLFVTPAAFLDAERFLQDEGYVRSAPAADMPRAARSMALYLTNAFEFYSADRNIKVELHHRLLRDPHQMALPFDTFFARSVTLPLADGTVQVLASIDASVFMCSHGAEHAFSRLKWLVDIARIFDQGADWTHNLRQHAREMHCERSVLLSLALLERLTGRPSPLQARERRAVANLATMALRAVHREEQPDLRRFTWRNISDRLRDVYFTVCLAEDRKSKGFRVVSSLCPLPELSTLGLGAGWWWLYALLAQPLAMFRILRRSFAGNYQADRAE